MNQTEIRIVEKIKKAMPYMSDFDKGYFLGKVEALSDQKENDTDKRAVSAKQNIG